MTLNKSPDSRPVIAAGIAEGRRRALQAEGRRLAKVALHELHAEERRLAKALHDLHSGQPEIAKAAELYIYESAKDFGVAWRDFSPLVLLPEEELNDHLIAVGKLSAVPLTMQGRGFTVGELRHLMIASNPAGAALFPLTRPDGAVLAIKRRNNVTQRTNPWRYDMVRVANPWRWPAWFSPGFMASDAPVLIIEGELNGMAAWYACPELAVMGKGCIPTEPLFTQNALKGRRISVYNDANAKEHRRLLAKTALLAGAESVRELEPWVVDGREMDACDIAGRLGRPALRARLLKALT